MANEKMYTNREVALAVLAKAQELLGNSELIKAEKAKVMSDYSGGQKRSGGAGYGKYQDQAQSQKGVHTPVSGVTAFPGGKGTSKAGDYTKDKYAGKPTFSGKDHPAIKEHKKVLGEMHSMPKPNLPKSEEMDKGNTPAPSLAMSEDVNKAENPDEKQDAKLGEEVEGLCERHMMDNKDAEKKEGHKIVKSEMCKMCKHGMNPEQMKAKMNKSEFEDLYEDLAKMKVLFKKEGMDENEIGTKFAKHGMSPEQMKAKMKKAEKETENKEDPSNPMKPRIEEKGVERDYSDFETKPGHSSTSESDHREEGQMAPESNPKEQKEGNNPPAGSTPGSGRKGVHKLSFFMGHRHHKSSMKKGIALS